MLRTLSAGADPCCFPTVSALPIALHDSGFRAPTRLSSGYSRVGIPKVKNSYSSVRGTREAGCDDGDGELVAKGAAPRDRAGRDGCDVGAVPEVLSGMNI